MSSWGDELWDQYPVLLDEVTKNEHEITSTLVKFVKERGEMEKEYAKSIRKLVNKFTNRIDKKCQDAKETSYGRAFRLMLQEIGFQAGQHEILAALFGNDIPKEIEKIQKIMNETLNENMLNSSKIASELENHLQKLEKVQKRYGKSYSEWEEAKNKYLKMDSNPNISRNEIAKQKLASETLNVEFEDIKGTYASQLLKTNKYQDDYYYRLAPCVLNDLQKIEIERIESIRNILFMCVKAEKQVAPIISRCRQDMEEALLNICPAADSEIFIDRFKTGNQPPGDIPFQETPAPLRNQLGVTQRRRSEQKLGKRDIVTGPHSKKRKIEEKMDLIKSKIDKGQKEINALRVMIQSYTQNPSFGDPRKFQEELDVTILRVQTLESDLYSQQLMLNDMEERNVNKSSVQVLDSSNPTITSPEGSRCSSTGYGTMSNYSDSDEECASVTEIKNREAIGHDVTVKSLHSFDTKVKAIALYPYKGDCGDSCISMKSGEEFLVIERDDHGWTKIRKENESGKFLEGFVPTSYIENI